MLTIETAKAVKTIKKMQKETDRFYNDLESGKTLRHEDDISAERRADEWINIALALHVGESPSPAFKALAVNAACKMSQLALENKGNSID